MSLQQIRELQVLELADQYGAHLYLWTTNNYLKSALDIVSAWGFDYVTTITWLKDKQGLGQYYRGITEHCIFARTHNVLPYKLTGEGRRCQGGSGFFEKKTIHSRKPDAMRRMIEMVSYAPRIELFARETFVGWDHWGNEI